MAETLVWHYLRKWAEHKPDEEALVYGDRRVTFGEFLAQPIYRSMVKKGRKRQAEKVKQRKAAGLMD
jgi:hypothetical protein